MEPIALFAVLLALALGVLFGWLVWGRAQAARDAERAGLDMRAREAERALGVAEERAGAANLLRTTLDGVTRERDEAMRDVAALRPVAARIGELDRALAAERDAAKALMAEVAAFQRGEAERERAHDAQLTQLKDMEAKLEARFADLANKALVDAQTHFLKRADERFSQSEEKAGEGLRALLQPVSDRLQRYEEGVAKVEAERRDAFGELRGQIEQMRIGQERVSSEAARLVNSLRHAPKARGRWGEQQLRNVLETCGLSEQTDFRTEVSVSDEEGGRLRPDAIVRVPGGRALVIDAKVSLNAYQDAFGASDEAERGRCLDAHAAAMRAHVNGLAGKAYWSQFADAPDYVIMFVPGEHFLSAALEQDSKLWDFAFEKRVLLATPTNLVAIARTVAAVWRQEKLATEARRIGELGELHDRLAVAAGHLRTVGSGLSSAVNNYNKFVGSFERNVLSTGRKFRELNIEPGAREIEEAPQVEALPRYADGPELLEDAAE